MKSQELAAHFMLNQAYKKAEDRQTVQQAETMIDAFVWEKCIEFGDWIHRNGYEASAVFPVETRDKWSDDNWETSKTTKQLYEEFIEQK